MPDTLFVLRRCLPLLLVVAVGCKNDDGETSESASTSASTGTPTGAGTDTDTGEASVTAGVTEATAEPTGGSGSASGSATGTPTSTDTGIMTTTESMTSEAMTTEPMTTTGVVPVPCDGPEGCTDMGEGDLDPFVLPFFRGTVCVSDAVKPGDPLALSVTTCAHPCLNVPGFKFKWAFRCKGGQGIDCEVGLAFFHPNTTGAACPPDVFGEFDPAICEDVGPTTLTIKPPATEGDVSFLMPFLSNADVAAIDGGMNDAASVWAMVDSHGQTDGRRIPLSFAADNPAAPAACGEGMPGCTCSAIGLP